MEDCWVFQPYSEKTDKTIEVSWGESHVSVYSNGATFGVPLFAPDSVDVWVHEFTEWSLSKIIPRIRNRMVYAHIMAAFHTVSGKEDLSLQTPEEFAANLLRSKYACLVRRSYQKRMEYFISIKGE